MSAAAVTTTDRLLLRHSPSALIMTRIPRAIQQNGPAAELQSSLQ
jgi:hypothetical protein